MDARTRRRQLLKALEDAGGPITGGELAQRLKVSRQVIVGDVALLRAEGAAIYATPAGYLLPPKAHSGARRVIAACHLGEDALLDELMTVVRLGGTVEDVSIEHKLYGEFRSPLLIGTEARALRFAQSLRESGMEPLSRLTGGVHLHTLLAPDEETLDRIERALDEKGYLLKDL